MQDASIHACCEPAFLALVTIVELVWVLESSYALRREQVAQAVAGLLTARELRIDRSDNVAQALRTYRTGKADFTDALIERIAHQADCEATLSFHVAATGDAAMRAVG